jgi:hypothetical protein
MKKLALGLPVLVLATAAVAATARGSESDRGRYTTAAPLGAADPPGSRGRRPDPQAHRTRQKLAGPALGVRRQRR